MHPACWRARTFFVRPACLALLACAPFGLGACGAENDASSGNERALEPSLLRRSQAALTALPAERALHAQGNRIVDAKGREVSLRGTNLGGWLVQENWMCGITDRNDDAMDAKLRGRFALNTLEDRFGSERAAALVDAWQDHFLTPEDFDRLKAMGVNVLRLPFWWRTLQHRDRSWRRAADGSIDFSRLDWAVDQAARRGMWVIPTLHIWYGQKKDYARISGGSREAAGDRQHAAELWRVTARHFAGNATIAAFDLINEPAGSPGNVLQDALLHAVRESDPERMVVVQSVDADAEPAGWTNVVFSRHEYGAMSGDPAANGRALAGSEGTYQRWARLGVPVYIGELMAQPEPANPTLDTMLKGYARAGFAWSAWTYKGVDIGNWASFNHGRELRVNVNTDSEATILRKWSTMGKPVANEAVLSRYRPYWSQAGGGPSSAAPSPTPAPASAGGATSVVYPSSYPAQDAMADLEGAMARAGDAGNMTAAQKKETVAALLSASSRHYPDLPQKTVVRLLIANMRQESDFRPGVIGGEREGSGAAYGLLQVSPFGGSQELALFARHYDATGLIDYATGQALAPAKITAEDLKRPWVNIHVASWIQSNLARSGSADPYNWGRELGAEPSSYLTGLGSWVAGPGANGGSGYRQPGDNVSQAYFEGILASYRGITGKHNTTEDLAALRMATQPLLFRR